MNTPRAPRIAAILLALAVALGVAVPAAAESADDLLEQGIYTEQTVGDLSAAMEIYTRILENDEANRPHVAQAQFRLGICHLKRGDDEQARTALERLIREFPEQEQLVAQAREQLALVQPALALESVPWKDGEFLEYSITLPTGKTIGNLYLLAESTVVNGAEAWRLQVRRLVFTSSDNQGVSRVLVDRLTQRPISSKVRHGVLGNADATYGVDGAKITTASSDTHVTSDQDLYDNEQSIHLLRMLPLEPGYEVKISFLPTWTGEILHVGLEVTGKETCRVPAGEFECYAVEFDNGQSYWVSTGRERYPLRVKVGGVTIELEEIGWQQPGAPVAFGMEDFGFSGILPDGWLGSEQHLEGRANKAMVRIVDPDAEAISAIEIDRCPQGRCPELLQTAERELAGARERFDGYALREGSWAERTIDGRPAIGFVGDYNRNGKPWVQYRVYTLTDDKRFEFIFRAPLERFEELRAGFDSVANHLETE